jgi:bifunctional non-homologous end joining protein LigD
MPRPKITPLGLQEIRSAFDDEEWLFELKHDGFRLLAARQADDVRLVYRRGNDATHVFPEIARAIRELSFPDLLIDGEVVVLDETGRPSFQGLQKRVQLRRRIDLERAARERPATHSRGWTCAGCRSWCASRPCRASCRPPVRCATPTT